MFCPQCGNKRRGDGARFCSGCGHNYDAEEKTKNIPVKKFPAGVAIVLLALALFADSAEMGFFTFLRWIITTASLYYVYLIYKIVNQWKFWTWTFILLAILFNPLVPIHLDRDTWQFFDFITLVLFSIYFFRLRGIWLCRDYSFSRTVHIHF
jgi:hypothetical protein